MAIPAGILSYLIGVDSSGVRRDPEDRRRVRQVIALGVAGSRALGEDADHLTDVLQTGGIPLTEWDLDYIRSELQPTTGSSSEPRQSASARSDLPRSGGCG